MEAISNSRQTSAESSHCFKPIFVLPGDNLTSTMRKFAAASTSSSSFSSSTSHTLRLGEGLVDQSSISHRKSEESDGDSIAPVVVSRQMGRLQYRPSTGSYWVETKAKRYIPQVSDQVVGVIDDRGGDFYKVNIGSGSLALLNRLAFEGATKRNRPELKKGDVVYCRIAEAHKDLDTELTCLSASGVKKDWSSRETIYGELSDGLIVQCSIHYAIKMLKPDCVVLNALGKSLAFEVAVGMNGLVWFRAGSVIDSIVIRNALINSELLDDEGDDESIESMVGNLVKRAASSRKK